MLSVSCQLCGIETLTTVPSRLVVFVPKWWSIPHNSVPLLLRGQCLDHVIVLNEQHLQSVLTEFVRYYNQERPDRTLGLQTPHVKEHPTTGSVRSHPVLNGLHNVYERAA